MKDFNKLINNNLVPKNSSQNENKKNKEVVKPSNQPLKQVSDKVKKIDTGNFLPSPIQMAKNLAKEITNNVQHKLKGNNLINTAENTAHRFKICSSCEFYIQSKDRCSKCGCKMKIKSSLNASKCPIGKW